VGFWFGCWVVELLEVLLGWIFRGFAEENRVLEDGCGHLLPILRVLRVGVKCFGRRTANTTLGISVG